MYRYNPLVIILLFQLACAPPPQETMPIDQQYLSVQINEGYYHTAGFFDIGAETLEVNHLNGKLPDLCNLTVYYRANQYITSMEGRYPTIFFLFKDADPNNNPDHFIHEPSFQLEFLTDEPCGDEYDLINYYTGTWEDQYVFLAAVLHPSARYCWTEGSFYFSIATGFPIPCP